MAVREDQRRRNTTLPQAVIGTSFSTNFTRGNKFFELNNHLGNVLVTISDKKIGVPQGNPNQGLIDYYTADVATAQDYAPFGSILSGRNYNAPNAANHRYGFNGKENDNEVKGEGNQIDFGARIYDSRIGRWLSLDPKMKKYPGESPYLYTGGNPIIFADPDGEDRIIKIYEIRDGKTTLIKVATYKGEYVWGKANGNSNIHMKKNINQTVTINYDNNTVTRSKAIISGDHDGKGYDDLGKLGQRAIDYLAEKTGEGVSDRGGWTLTASSGSGTDAGNVIKGNPSGSINTDYIGVVTYLVASPNNLEESLLNFGGAAVSLTATKSDNGKPYLPEGLIPVPGDADKRTTSTDEQKLELHKEIKTKTGPCQSCSIKEADSGHVNQAARNHNNAQVEKLTKKEE